MKDAYSLILAAIEEFPHIPVCMHQDHGNDEATCASAIAHGFTSVMMDGSLEADGKSVASYEYNVEVSRKVVEAAHSIGITVEAELGVLGSLETMKGDKEDGHGAEGTMTREQLLVQMPAGAARNALDSALWDLECRLHGQSLWQRSGVTAPAHIRMAQTVSIGTPEAMAFAARELEQQGATLLKIKLDDHYISERLVAIRAAVPSAGSLTKMTSTSLT